MGWDQLAAIYQEAKADHARQQAERPQACPNDGEPLDLAPDGTWFCMYDGWKWGG